MAENEIYIRTALKSDIPSMQVVRNSVKENKLSNPALVTDKDVENYILNRGKGWVCEINSNIVGFAIADLVGKNIWALFVEPRVEKMGIGRRLHQVMVNWYFNKQKETLWLSTSPGTRAAEFYPKLGWKQVGTYGKGELKFELTYEGWLKAIAV